jgi:hypothetical protein
MGGVSNETTLYITQVLDLTYFSRSRTWQRSKFLLHWSSNMAGHQGTTLENRLLHRPKGPSIFFIIIISVQRVLFFTTPSPLKVCKSSEKNWWCGRFNEIKHADQGSWKQNKTSFRAGSLGRHDHTNYISTSCTKIKNAYLCGVLQCLGVLDYTLCGELPHILAWSCQFTLQK